jgi:ABC-2 type transport system ATP-binding protein
MIMNIFFPDRGTIHVFGDELQGACTNRIGYLPEERGLYKKMKVRELLRFYGEIKKGPDIKQEVDRWLKKLDLSDWGDKKVDTLSKGMSQKVQFIATVVSSPDLIILDEPFTGLDPVNADVIREAVLELQAQGTTVVFSTHDMTMAERMCDFIFMIHKGRKVLDGTLTDIQSEYGSDTLRVRVEDGVPALQDLSGVEKVTDFGQMQELRMTRDYDAQQVLSAMMVKTRITSFEVAKPSLHDIFIRIAGPEAEEANHVEST